MTIKYFKDVKTVQQLRKIYVKLLKQYHPDNGGAFSSINDAMANVEKLRPASKPLNSMCNNCKNDKCTGEFNRVYTGCIYKEF